MTGFGEALRYFNSQQNNIFAELEYEIPIKTQKGSWEMVLYAAGAIGGAFSLAYAKKAGEKMAENDFKDIGLKDVFQISMNAILKLIDVMKKAKGTVDFSRAKMLAINGVIYARINLADDSFIDIEAKYHQWYKMMPQDILYKITSIISKDRIMEIGVKNNGRIDKSVVTESEKNYFIPILEDEQEEDLLFPELRHGDYVNITGSLIRGNQSANSLGLRYQGHVINCTPDAGSVKNYVASWIN